MTLGEVRKVLSAETKVIGKIQRLVRVIGEVWLFDMARPGVRTGFQTKSLTLESENMWYSPTETQTATAMLKFAKDWFSSYYGYSNHALLPVLVDFGAGAGKVNIIANEIGYPLTIAFEIDQDLLTIAEKNFSSVKNRRKRGPRGIMRTMAGDVSSKKDISELRARIESTISDLGGEGFILIAYNKNSYGPEVLDKALSHLDEVFGKYAYLYQNPVHISILEKKGLTTQRIVLDGSLRKNKDWLLATRD